MFFKIGVLSTIFQVLQEMLESLFNKDTGLKTCNFIRRNSSIDAFL